ncbi:MAG TPA: PhoH family protein [Bacteroidales bacterium]|jgi:phosphate starvation-inducible PhoH-like protein|nr:PhoH family protein [Bacteroidales bacterium]
MTESTFSLESYSPLEIFGINDRNINLLRELFPKLKIIARDAVLRINGDEQEIETFSQLFTSMLMFFDNYGRLDEDDIRKLAGNGNAGEAISTFREANADVLVHGKNGMMIRARTVNQEKMVNSIADNDMIFAIGPAGTGKTYTAVALAVRALKNKEVRRIVLTRPAVEAGENLGFLPGDLKDKLDPYLQPLYDALRDMIPTQKLVSYLEDGTIEIAPLAFMRGRTLENAFAILDEAQNCTEGQLKMFVTRMGRSSKFVITGDITQIDLPRNQNSGLVQAMKILKNIKGIDFITLDIRDVVRHKLVTRIINAYEKKE